MGRGPSQIGRAPAHLTVLPGGASHAIEDEDERTTLEPEPQLAADESPTPIVGAVDEQWEDGTTVAESGEKRLTATIDEPTVEDQPARSLPPLQLVQGTATGAADPRASARLHVIAGSDQGRIFDLRPGKELQVGRAVDNDVCLTDIAVSRRHLELSWDGDGWILRDRGSGNGTLINDRIEDGKCQLRHGDRIEIGNTIFRFDHLPSASTPSVTGWGQDDDEAATVAGKGGRPPSNAPVADAQRGRPAAPTLAPQARDGRAPPPPRSKRLSATIEGRPDVVARPRPTNDATPAAVPVAISAANAGPVALPQFLSAQAPPGPSSSQMTAANPFGPAGGRPMTVTAHVEPRAYAPAPYPFIVAPDASRRKHLLIGAGVATVLALIGIAAMLAGDDNPGAVTGSVDPAKTVESSRPRPAVAPDPVPAPPPSAPDPVPVPVPDPVAIKAPEPAPVPVAPIVKTPDPVIVKAPDPTPVAPIVKAPDPTPVAPIVKAPTPPPTPKIVKAPPAPTPPKAPPPTPKVVKKPEPRVAARVPPPEPVDKRAPRGGAAAEKKADALYKGKDFKSAAEVIREASEAAATDDVRRLKSLAADYDSIGTNLTAGTAMAKAKPTDALGSLKKALTADRRVGGAHQQGIREKLAQVAPAAAALYMAKQNYPMAKIAADDAVNYGSGSNATVANVRQSLERKAQEFYGNAQKLLKDQPEEAKSLLRQITKIVPTDSPWYGKAYKQLNQRTPARTDDDE